MTRATRRTPLVKQELVILPEFTPVVWGVHCDQSLLFCIMFWRSLFVIVFLFIFFHFSMVLSVLQFTVSNCSLVSWNFASNIRLSEIKLYVWKLNETFLIVNFRTFIASSAKVQSTDFFKLYSYRLLQSKFHMKTNDNPLFASWTL